MNIKEMLTEALKANDFDGLCHPDMECGCTIDDLFPCGNPDWEECIGGFKYLQDDGDWIIGSKKEDDLELGS